MTLVVIPRFAQLIVILLSAYIVYRGKIEWALGIYLSMPSWVSVIQIGRINHVWFSMLVLLGAGFFFWFRSKDLRIFPRRNAWIVFWMFFWWLWVLFLMITTTAPMDWIYQIYVTFLCYCVLPVPFFLIISKDLGKLKGFAMAYMINMMGGGLLALSRLRAPLSYVVKDPLLMHYYGVKGGFHTEMNVYNYHTFGLGFAIAFIIAIVLMEKSENLLSYLLYMGSAIYCIYFLFLSNSKQSISSAIVVGTFLVFWLQLQSKTTTRLGGLTALALIGLTVSAIYAARPELVLRNYRTLGEAFDIVENRGFYWQQGLTTFADSPIWGDRFEHGVSWGHNYFISTLSNQGIVGFLFVLGFLIFLFLQTKGILAGKGPRDLANWRMGALCITLVNLLTSQVSGSSVTSWPIFWGAAILWQLRDSINLYEKRPMPVARSSRELSIEEIIDNVG